MDKRIGGIRVIDFEIIDVSKTISDIRLIVGGAAIFADVATNHHIQRLGRAVRRPLVRNRLRVLVVSYVIPAKENMAGEDSPCASIIARAPALPHLVREQAPAIIRAMCATDE